MDANTIKKAYEQMKNANAQSYNQMKQAKQNEVNQLIADENQRAFSDKNMADIDALQASKRNRELIASQGGYFGGDNVTANVGLEAQRQNRFNSIDSAKANAIKRYNMDLMNQNSRLDADLLGMNSKLDSELQMKLLDIENARRAAASAAARKAAAERKRRAAENLTPMDWAKRELNAQMRNGTAAEWLSKYRQPVMDAVGSKNFTSLIQRKNNLRSQTDMDY